jgi:hypothetical protein
MMLSNNPSYAFGAASSGRLQVTLSSCDNLTILGMSGGWRQTFTVPGSAPVQVTLSFHYNLTQAANYESDEYSEVLATVGTLDLGTSGQNYVARIASDGNGGTARTTGWQTFATTPHLAPGTYALTLGGYNNKRTYNDETTAVLIDDVLVTINTTSTTSVQTAQRSLQEINLQQPFQPLETIAMPEAAAGMVADAQPASPTPSLMQTLVSGQKPQQIWLEAEA